MLPGKTRWTTLAMSSTETSIRSSSSPMMPAITCTRSDRKSTRLNSSHVSNSYANTHYLHSLPTRRSSDVDDGSSSSQNQQNQQSQQNQSSTDLTKQEFDVAWQDALDDARDEFDGDVNKIELEPNDAGNYVYKIELLSDTQKFAMQVDATSGETVNKKTEDLESDERGAERREERIDLQKVIP